VTDKDSFRILLAVVAVLQIVISLPYVRKARAGSTIFRRREEGLFLTGTLVLFYLAYGVGFVAYLINPNWMAWSAVAIPPMVRWLGSIPLLLGATFMVWGLHQIGRNITISISTREDHALVTTGPYRLVRHPLYTGGMVEAVGVCLLMANWFVALSAGLFWSLIAYRTPMEEKKLIKTFGDEYRQYMERVGRFLPLSKRPEL
jgi:protein-S-isoprenylcysteine O-methyltransferase Ste14